MARQLLTEGHAVLCISRTEQAALALHAEQSGATLLQWCHDLTDGQGASERLESWLREQDPLAWQSATLINNAGVIARIAPLSQVKAGMDHFTRCLALEEAAKPHGARVCSLAPGVIDTDMQTQLRSAAPEAFPDQGSFARLKSAGQLTSPDEAAHRVLAYLARLDFGAQPVADVRD